MSGWVGGGREGGRWGAFLCSRSAAVTAAAETGVCLYSGPPGGEASLTWFELVTLGRTLTSAAARMERGLIRKAPSKHTEGRRRWGSTPNGNYYPCTSIRSAPPHTPTPSNPAPINHLGFKIFTCCLPVSVTTFRGPALSSGPLLGRVTGGLPAPAHPLYCLVTSAVRRRLLSNSQGPTTSASLLKYAVLRTEVKVFD